MIKGNKGEWSEFYVFLKLLAEGKIYAADKNLIKNEQIFYKILKIIRGKEYDLEYIRDQKIIIQDEYGNILSTLKIDDVKEISKKFYLGISEDKTNERAFALDFAEKVMNEFHTDSLSDNRKETADIRIVIHDPITQFEPLLGFSIKSYIGSKPTLFNASKNTNFIYKINPTINKETRIFINNLETYGQRIKWLKNNGYILNFIKINSEIFQANLELIDSKLPEIMASLILNSFIHGKTKLTDLIKIINEENPCNYNLSANSNFYSYKLKRVLVDSALGMKAAKVWNGTYNANGGYIIVKKDGDLVCYHIYNWNEFQDYLLTHTKIDYPDSKPNRCDYGRILDFDEIGEKEGSYIKLNFQLRFI